MSQREPLLHQGDDEWAARACDHPDCDGWRMHSVEAVQENDGTWKPACPLCGPIPVVGSGGSADMALAMARDHNYSERCDGRCLAWFEEAA